MRTKVLVCLLSFWLAVILLAYGHRINEISQTVSGEQSAAFDYQIFYHSAQLFWAGANIYQSNFISCLDTSTLPIQIIQVMQPNANLNPPFFTLLIAPLAKFSFTTSTKIWLGLLLVMNVAGVLLLRRSALGRGYSVAFTLALVGCVLAYYPTFSDIKAGQLGPLVFLFLTAIWLASRSGKDKIAGILLGIIVGIKLFIGLLVVFFLLQRRWRLVLISAATFLLCLLLSRGIFNHQTFVSYYHNLSDIGWYASSWNASFYAFVKRLFGGVGVLYPLWQMPHLATYLYYVGVLVCLAAFGWLSWPTNIKKELNFDLGFSFAMIAMLLISPFGWLYYFSCLLIPTLVIFQHARTSQYAKLLSWSVLLPVLISAMPVALIPPSQQTTAGIVLFWTSYSYYALLLFALAVLLAKIILNKTTTPMANEVVVKRLFIDISIVIFLFSLLPHGIFGSVASHAYYRPDHDVSIAPPTPNCQQLRPDIFNQATQPALPFLKSSR